MCICTGPGSVNLPAGQQPLGRAEQRTTEEPHSQRGCHHPALDLSHLSPTSSFFILSATLLIMNTLLHPGKRAVLNKTVRDHVWPQPSTGERSLRGIRSARRARGRPLAPHHCAGPADFCQTGSRLHRALPLHKRAARPHGISGVPSHSNDGSCSEQVPLLKGLHLSGTLISCSLLIYLFNQIELLETGPQWDYLCPLQHFPFRHVTSQHLVGCALLRQHR